MNSLVFMIFKSGEKLSIFLAELCVTKKCRLLLKVEKISNWVGVWSAEWGAVGEKWNHTGTTLEPHRNHTGTTQEPHWNR